jgi:hypothetical protein
MADSRAVESGKEAAGSQTQDAGLPSLARGAAGAEKGARAQSSVEEQGDLEQRRETEQVLRPSSDGMGDGLVKDRS